MTDKSEPPRMPTVPATGRRLSSRLDKGRTVQAGSEGDASG